MIPMKEKLIIASNNPNKIREIKAILGDRFGELLSLREAGIEHETVEDGESFLENAEKKAREIAELSGCAAIADDSGLCVDALGGAPGVYSARYCGHHGDDEANNRKLLKDMEGIADRSAHYTCAIVLCWPDGRILSAEDYFHGIIAEAPVGTGGFGYDPLFFLPRFGRTLACISPEEKNSVSHRSLALQRLAGQLDDLSRRPPIVLGGFMGVGKSAVGRLLADRLGYAFADMDDFVAELAGESIRSMLEQNREPEVRLWESRAAARLASRPGTVISTGGGVLASEKNGLLFRKTALIVHVTRNFNEVYPLISCDPVRRLAYGKSREELQALLDSRMAAYSKYAALTVSNDGSPEECAEEIAIFYQRACNSRNNLI